MRLSGAPGIAPQTAALGAAGHVSLPMPPRHCGYWESLPRLVVWLGCDITLTAVSPSVIVERVGAAASVHCVP